MPRVFLSHTSADKPFVERLAGDLMRLGLDVWYDKWDIHVGDSIVWKIEEGLRESDWLALILSPQALQSEWVRSEIAAVWNMQMRMGKPQLLPVFYQNCEIPLFLAERKYADFRTDYQQGLAELAAVFGIQQLESPSAENWRLFMRKRNADWKSFRQQEFQLLVKTLVDCAGEYRWSVWVGRSRSPFAVTLYTNVYGHSDAISIRLIHGEYYASRKPVWNPSHLRAADYTIRLGTSIEDCKQYALAQMETFCAQFGKAEEKPHYLLDRRLQPEDYTEIISTVLQKVSWYPIT